ncbi:sugar ABC transporter ATPase [Amycolatopsis mediterranei S699]|uniref:ATPase component of ABC-type sugar transport system n=2 Tax=Amycolatopsis mediterranei TaxID=33910 RepID=A0A0H3D9E7_AMYMU|nr:ATPase component of ABC-type sugar transport system [Amycolatopsis mediterranei U32]AFO77880.1 sugar ABC transporter ATPase [Amycolatopsis mediterranei S699]AGT85008.1 sugar ABC transporter ATPase [Amycolatopsis mediterranei RB]KDO05705.1 sugar ABC transporter ATP-binding protein [Amycolatopsis mediterranei]KDU87890.1 sugar ABC transporter ATP-binding protein [Amycolatopsis mediterranei]
MPEPQPMVRMSGIRKEFPGVLALDGVDFRMYPGEVHALMGENGAGKSTLIKVLTGVYGVDAGTIELNGDEVAFTGPGEAQQAGISTVYQEVNLCPNLSVAENVCLGREPRRFGRIQWGLMRRRAEELLARLDVHVDVSAELSTCSIAVQQLVAIARALDVDARVLVLDEPTSSLDAGEVEKLLKVVRALRETGMAILFVSHFIDQVFAIADRMTVLRNGKLIGEYPTAEITPVELVTKMIGKELQVLEDLEDSGPSRAEVAGAPVLLAAEGLGRKGGVAPFDLDIHAGEVVGLAGLLGSGRTELARLLFGADHADSGSVKVDGDPTSLRTPRAGLDHKIAFLSENRKAEGLVEELTVRENIVLALQASRGWARPLSRRRQDEIAEKYIKTLDIRPANPEALVGNLSGGNQQKVLLARWLITEPRLLILDEPTRGIDIGAKTEIQRLVTQLSAEGMAVVYISAELEEVLRLSHRVVVLRDRKVVAERENQALTADDIMATMAEGVQA